MPSGKMVQHVTKLDAARRQLVTASRLFFDDREPVSVHTLAEASFEISESLCRHHKVKSFLDYAEDVAGSEAMTDFQKIYSRHKNFVKHADRDPDAYIDDFSDHTNEHTLYAASQNLKLLCSHKLAIEAWVIIFWVNALYFEESKGTEDYEWKLSRELFPQDLINKSRAHQKALGKKLVSDLLSQPGLVGEQFIDRTQIKYWT